MNRDVENLLERYDRSIAEVESRAVNRVNKALNKAFRELVRELRPVYRDVAPNLNLLPNQRKLLIVNQIKDLLKVVRPDARRRYEGIFNNLLEESEDLGGDMATELMNLLDNKKFALTRSTAGLPIEALTLAAQDSVNRLIRHGETFASRATAVIEQGIIRGWSNQRLSRVLRGELDIVKTRADRIARTETNSVFNQAAENNYNRNGFKYVQIYATADRRLCPYCGARFGNVYRLGEIRVPFHVSCRCALVPFRKSWYEEKTLNLKGIRELRKEAISEMKARGIKSNFGVAPFERAAGLSEAPKPVWRPSDNIEKMPSGRSEVRSPSPNQEINKFPDRLDQLELVRDLGGSTGAQLYENPKTKQQYVLKGGRNESHIKTEMLADSLYLASGVKVPEFRKYRDADGNLLKLAEYIQGRSLQEFLNTATDLEIEQVKKQLQENFAIDALLGNWDVAGLTNDNIIVDSDLVAWRIDNGGSLDRRATGVKKNSVQWNEYADELWSMRDPNINRNAADMFGSMSWGEVVRSAKKIDRKKIVNAIDDDQLKSDISARLDKLADLIEVNDTMSADKFKLPYLDDFSRHYFGLQKDLLEVLPKKMINPPSKFNRAKLVDENGKLFDNFREEDENSIQVKIEKYIDRIGDFNVIKTWASEQSADSWNENPVSYKYFLYSQARDVDFDDFYWGKYENKSKVKACYTSTLNKIQVNQEVYRQSFTAFHAFNYLIASKVDLPNNIKSKKAIRLIRTESDKVMDIYNPGRETGIRPVMKRGMAESTSLVRHVVIAGSHVTYQEVPYHRILGTYLIERGKYNEFVKKMLYTSFFMSDVENEVIAMMDGLPHEYAGEIDPNLEEDDPFLKPTIK